MVELEIARKREYEREVRFKNGAKNDRNEILFKWFQ